MNLGTVGHSDEYSLQEQILRMGLLQIMPGKLNLSEINQLFIKSQPNGGKKSSHCPAGPDFRESDETTALAENVESEGASDEDKEGKAEQTPRMDLGSGLQERIDLSIPRRSAFRNRSAPGRPLFYGQTRDLSQLFSSSNWSARPWARTKKGFSQVLGDSPE
jgi:hypothetical protein